MSDLLTTGQMIDRLKVGEVAECVKGVLKGIRLKRFVSKEIGQFLAREDGSTFSIFLSESYLGCKWRIIPEFVTFDKAMAALMEGKTVWAWKDGEKRCAYKIDKETGDLWAVCADGSMAVVTKIAFFEEWTIGE